MNPHPGEAVTGIVVPSRWDEQGGYTGLAIQAFDEKEYRVRMNKMGRALISAVGHMTNVNGHIFRTMDGRFWIRVSQFEILKKL